MEIKDLLNINIQSALKELGVSLELNDIIVEVSKDPTHGDYASNVALKSARNFGKAPRDVANLIVDKINKDKCEKIQELQDADTDEEVLDIVSAVANRNNDKLRKQTKKGN